MTSSHYIQERQQAWAIRRGIGLQGSAGERGEPNYTKVLGDNIFGGAFLPAVETAFKDGAGGELRGTIPTMSALHSSAALAVNLFQHWVARQDATTPAGLLGVPSRSIDAFGFEGKFPVSDISDGTFPVAPHLDFAFRYADGGRVGVECKLHEPYGRLDHKALRGSYLELADAWADIPAWRALAEKLAGAHVAYRRLGASQLVKHVLGLRHGVAAQKVRLVYLYLDAPGVEAAEHRQELASFEEAVKGDPIGFQPLTVQEFIVRAVHKLRAEHTAYVDYLAERYL